MSRELENILAIPAVDDARRYYKNDSLSYDDVALIQFYKYLITDYFKGLGVFDEAEQHLREADAVILKDEKKDFFQKTDLTGYDYFYLCSIVRIDRIPDDIKKEMLAAMENPSDSRLMERARGFAVSMISDVLMADRNRSNHSCMMFYELGVDGIVADDEIAFGFASDASFDGAGNYVSKENEDERVKYMLGSKDRIKQAFWEKTGCKMQLFVRI